MVNAALVTGVDGRDASLYSRRVIDKCLNVAIWVIDEINLSYDRARVAVHGDRICTAKCADGSRESVSPGCAPYYRSLLGQPSAIGSDTTDGLIQTTTRWQNRDTEFVIAVLTPPHEDIAAFAQLIDRRTKRGETERR